jgi:hypothetical protein
MKNVGKGSNIGSVSFPGFLVPEFPGIGFNK